MKIWVALRQFAFAIALASGSATSIVRAEPPPLSAYGDLPAVEDLVLSPDGTRFATLATIAGERLIMIYDDQGQLLSRMKVGDLKIRDLKFVSNDLLLMQRSTTENLGYGFTQQKAELFQVFIMPVELDRLELVFGNRRDLISVIFGDYGVRWVEGRPKAYFGAVELVKQTAGRGQYEIDHLRPALFEVDLQSNGVRQVAGAPRAGIDRDWLVDVDGSVMAFLDRSLTEGGWVIRNYDGDAIASGKNPTANAYFVAIGADGSSVIYSSLDESMEEVQWFEVPVDGSGPPVEFLSGIDVRRVYTNRRTGRLIGYRSGEAGVGDVFLDSGKEARVSAARGAFRGMNPRLAAWNESMNRVVLETNGGTDSGTYYFVNLETGQASSLLKVRPNIAAEDVGPVSRVEYSAADGMEMDGILTLPPDREALNLPVIMLPHGGPHSHDSAVFDWWAQAFASRGYAVFQPNFRGSTNRDQEFVRAGFGEWGGKMQSDISDGLAMLAEKGIVDPQRACIVGASYGGYAALAGVTLQQGLYRCAVSVAGVSDVSLMSRIERAESGRSKVVGRSLERQLGPPSRYKEISPRHHADRADAPILLIHGRDDTVVAYDQSTKMADALKDAGKPYEFLELEGEDHWLSLGETRNAMLKATLAFVQEHNPAD